jgi:hypothetical protein
MHKKSMQDTLTHLTYNLIQQKEVQLAQHEERRSKYIVPHRLDLVEDDEDDVGHDAKVEQGASVERE